MRLSPKQLRKEFHVCEYPTILRAAENEGWLNVLIESHLTPCSQEEARRLLDRSGCRFVTTRFNMRPRARGRFNPPKNGQGLSLSLPGRPGSRFGFLRVGIVLHEAAHLLDYRKRIKTNHQPSFQREFRSLLRKLMTTTTPVNFRPIYDRHQGPYVLLMLRENAKGQQFTDRVTGSSLRAQAAHEKAVELVNQGDPKYPDVDSVFVFSDTEGQFTGALYRKGESYAGWEHLPIDDAPPVDKRSAARKLLDVRKTTTLPELAAKVEADANAPAASPRKKPGDRFPVMRGRPLVPNLEGEWPKSAPAQLVRSHFEFRGANYSATSAELIAEIGTALAELKVQFPASLISRLKQAGLLKEKIDE